MPEGTSKTPSPPALGAWLLTRVCAPRYRDIVQGDLRELFCARVGVRGRRRAVIRYFADVLSLLRTGYKRDLLPSRNLLPSRFDRGSRRSRYLEVVMTLLQDLRHAARSLIKTPAFTGVVVLTLGLAIGANSAIFSIVDGVLLRPLPYDSPDDIVLVRERGQGEMGEREEALASQALFLQWRETGKAFERLAMYTNQAATMTGREEPVRLTGVAASPALFPLLRVDALRGRTFAQEEEERGEDGVMLISHRAWHRYFGGDAEVVGSSLVLDGRPRTLVGIMPEGFEFPDVSVEYWVPMLASPPDPSDEDSVAAAARQGQAVRETRTQRGGPDAGRGGRGGSVGRGGRGGPGGERGGGGGDQGGGGPEAEHHIELWARVVGRLAAGITPAMAAEEGTTLVRGLREYDGDPEERGAEVVRLQEQKVGPVRRSLLTLAGAVGFVLLIACANVANLMMARSVERSKETAVRAALGAGWLGLMRLLLIESLLLALAGGVLGLGLAYGGLRVLSVLGPEFIPRLEGVGIDARALQFTAFVSVLTAVLFSLIPARSAVRLDLTRALKEELGAGGAIRRLGRDPLRKLLVTAEVALSVVLLVGAGLLVSSFMRLTSVDPGYDIDNLLHVQLQLPGSGYPDAASHLGFYDQLVERLEAIPEVQSATVINQPPSLPANVRIALQVRRDEPPSPDERPTPIGVRIVENGYFETLRTHTVRGRVLGEQDRPETLPVAVLSESGAAALFGDEDPLGESMPFMGNQPIEIVGIVKDVRVAGVDPTPQADLFLPYYQAPERMVPMLFRVTHLLVRTGPAPLSVLPAIRTQVRQLDPSVIVLSVATMRDQLADSVAEPRFYASLVGAFALLALTLAAVGIYGMLSYSVQQGVRETAIRRALGAQAGRILGRVVMQGMVLATVGLALGIASALVLTRFLESMLYEIEPTEPATLATVVAVFLAVAFVAIWMPARRALRIDPMDALRYEG